MAFTQADLDAIDRALATSANTVEYDGRRVTYKSNAELLAARSIVAEALASTAGAPVTRLFLVCPSKGLAA